MDPQLAQQLTKLFQEVNQYIKRHRDIRNRKNSVTGVKEFLYSIMEYLKWKGGHYEKDVAAVVWINV